MFLPIGSMKNLWPHLCLDANGYILFIFAQFGSCRSSVLRSGNLALLRAQQFVDCGVGCWTSPRICGACCLARRCSISGRIGAMDDAGRSDSQAVPRTVWLMLVFSYEFMERVSRTWRRTNTREHLRRHPWTGRRWEWTPQAVPRTVRLLLVFPHNGGT